jgi:asparagine synthase (glutamine-hydrolysing)
MLAGAWGVHAGELLDRAAERRGVDVYRVDELTMLRVPDIVHAPWCCWLFGAPEDRGELASHFGLQTRGELGLAFGRALVELGEQACALLCGRFVMVALDRERCRCVVARDQVGAQPLVHASATGGVVFAEHERELLELFRRAPAPDRLSLLAWLDGGVIPRGRTFYEALQRLPAGHRLILEGTGASVECWWRARYEGVEQGSHAELGERLRNAAFAAVARATAASQRPAVKLSGGLDSACIAAGLRASGIADGRARALGGTFADHPLADESWLIEATARVTSLPLELIAFDSSSSLLAPQLDHIARWRLPPGTPNLFLWQPVLARARATGVDLMLDGEGGDELFGLAPYLIADRIRAGRAVGAWALSGRIPGMGAHPERSVQLRVLRRYGLAPLVPGALMRRRELARSESPGSLVAPTDARALVDLRIATHEHRHDGPLWWRHQAERLIDERDEIDMAAHFRREATDAAIDIRHPLLHDLKLIETALRLPPEAQFDAVRDRPLLRDGLAGLIPEAVRTRYTKGHFTTLVLAGMRSEEQGLLAPLHAADAPIRAYVTAKTLERRIGAEPDSRSMLAAGSLWRLAIANRWLMSLLGPSS